MKCLVDETIKVVLGEVVKKRRMVSPGLRRYSVALSKRSGRNLKMGDEYRIYHISSNY